MAWICDNDETLEDIIETEREDENLNNLRHYIYDFQQNKLVTAYLYQLSNNINKIEATIWWEKWTQEKTIKIRHQ